MPDRLYKDRARTKLAVLAPVIVLTLIFAGLLVWVLSEDGFSKNVGSATLLWGGAIYVLAAGLLVQFGLANIDRLESLGLTDSLSGAANRRALHLEAARRSGTEGEMALALIDLDGFKQVNDQYGHIVGDRVIKECALILKEFCGRDGSFYRLGGDEFAILVVGPIAANILEGICHKILSRFTKPIQIDDRSITLGASVGLSRNHGDESIGSSELLRRSDMAMYASKTNGKMRCTWFNDDFDRKRDATHQIEAELRVAMQEQEFRLLYQPLVDAKTARIVAVEALLRWDRKDRQPIGPDVFIPIAEESGLIEPIGLWVLRQGCLDAMAWDDVKLSINVSAAQLRNPEFPIFLGQILEETEFPPERLELEVTETYLVLDPAVAGRSMELIKEFGVSVVLDDFGTGYASIGFLRKFRFEKLKIDRSLIVDAATDGGSHAMMMSSIAVARAMDMDVTAEGVETEAQANLVRVAGCDQIQGWHFFRPIPADDVSEKLAAQAAGTDGRQQALRA